MRELLELDSKPSQSPMPLPAEGIVYTDNGSFDVPMTHGSGEEDLKLSSEESLCSDNGSLGIVPATCDSGEDDQKLEVEEGLYSNKYLLGELSLTYDDGNNEQRSAAKDFVLNPRAYYEEIQALESAVVSEYPLSSFLELLREGSHWIALSKTTKITDFHWKDGIDIAVKELEKTKQLSDETLVGLDLLKSRGFAGDKYNILVLDPARSEVAHIVSISRKTLASVIHLTDMVLEAMRLDTETLSTVFRRTRTAIALIEQAAKKILKYLHLPNYNANTLSISRVLQLHIAMTRILLLGLVSYTSSHTGQFDETHLGQRCEKISVYDGGVGISLQRQRLACLDAFVGQSVWVFRGPRIESFQSKLYLSCLISDLADIWGSARFVYSDDTLDMVLRIHLGSGMIFVKTVVARESSESNSIPAKLPQVQADEILCHWSSYLEKDLEGNEEYIPFEPTTRLLIGASHFSRNENCQRLTAVPSSGYFLGSEESRFKADVRTATLSVSKIVGVGISKSQRLHPGRTLKSLVINEWVEHWGGPRSNNPDPFWLDIYAGLEISACTGNAQRLRLWQLLRIECVVEYVVRTFCQDKDQEVWKERC